MILIGAVIGLKLIDIVPLQEPGETQFQANFTKEIKRKMKGMGWTKGSRIAVYQNGAGFFLTLLREEPTPRPDPDPSDKKLEPEPKLVKGSNRSK